MQFPLGVVCVPCKFGELSSSYSVARCRFTHEKYPALRDDEHKAVLVIVNDAAESYRGVIPHDRWHEPYMSLNELVSDIAPAGSRLNISGEGTLIGLAANCSQTCGASGPMLVGTWAAAVGIATALAMWLTGVGTPHHPHDGQHACHQ